MSSFAFDKQLCDYFGASVGAHSRVTETEYGDSQVTVTGAEKDIMLSKATDFLQDKLGSVKSLSSLGISAEYEFLLYPSGKPITLNLLYPKPNKTELRLYLRKGIYAPQVGNDWCVFIRNDRLWLGSFDHASKALLPTFVMEDSRDEVLEPEVDQFQTLVNTPIVQHSLSGTMVWGRNPKTAQSALVKADYVCEILPELPQFVARSTGKPYMESHHLIPMKLQDQFENSLDVVENICALNPLAHRFVHHGKPEELLPHIERLSIKREKYLQSIDFSVQNVLSLYS